MPTDDFDKQTRGLSSPGEDDIDIDAEKNDTADLSKVPRAVYVGADGNIKMQLKRSAAPRTWTGVKAGTVLAVRPVRVWSTGTTATGLIGIL